ncbi:MAG: HAD hydrolase-like protein [Balneolaceae bacterium]
MPEKHPWIILFDIDGTLLTVDRSFNRPLLRSIIDDLGINYPNMESDPFSGRTDYDIITSFLVHHDFDEQLYNTFKSIYLRRLSEEIADHHVLRHNHVDEAIDYFSNLDFVVGLLTGNYPDAAVIKLKVAGIHYEFAFGAFGEYHKDRNMLPQLALTSIKEMLKIEPDPTRFIIIGDTPRDIVCAQSAGMKSIAVTTGKFSSEELSKYNPDLIITSLENPEEWFSKLITG